VLFVRYLRDAIRAGAITSTVRIWQRQHVTAGKRYRLDDGFVEVESVTQISVEEITPKLALECGFASPEDLLKVAKHGRGESVYYIRFRYIPPDEA